MNSNGVSSENAWQNRSWSLLRRTPNLAIFLGAAVLLIGCAASDKDEIAVPSRAIDISEISRVSTSPLALTDAVRFGVLSSSAVATADIAMEQRKNEVVLAKAAFQPELYFNISPSGDKSLGSGNAGIRFTLYDFGERAALLNASMAGVERSNYEVFTEIDAAVERTVRRYIDLAVETDQVAAAQSYMANIRALESRVQSRVEIGAASAVDLNEVRTAVLEVQSDMIGARADLDLARAELASLIGVNPRQVLGVSQLRKLLLENENLTKPAEIETYPKVAALMQQLREDTYRKEALQAGLFTRIGVALGMKINLGSSGLSSDNGLVAGLDISDSISLGGGRNERRENAQLDVAATLRRLDEEIRLVRLEFQQARIGLASSDKRLRQQRSVLALSRKTRDLMIEEFELGSRSLRDLLDAEERIFRARQGLNEASRRILQDNLRAVMAQNLTSERLYSGIK